MLLLTDYNNLFQFMDRKSLSAKQARLAQKFSRYSFSIDYRQMKANKVTDTFSSFSQNNQAKKNIPMSENTYILHCQQSLLTKTSLSSLTANICPTNTS